MTIPPPPPDQNALAELTLVVGGVYARRSSEEPLVTLDGQPVPARRGVNRYPVLPGQHTVRVEMTTPSRRPYGAVEQVLGVGPGAVTEAYYGPPAWRFLAGTLTPAPAGLPGRDALVLLVGLLLGLGFGLAVAAVVLFAIS